MMTCQGTGIHRGLKKKAAPQTNEFQHIKKSYVADISRIRMFEVSQYIIKE